MTEHANSLYTVGLVKGLNEVLKALDRKQALIAVLAADCEDSKYKKFVTVSCHFISLYVFSRVHPDDALFPPTTS